jgi:hypothetical protein
VDLWPRRGNSAGLGFRAVAVVGVSSAEHCSGCLATLVFTQIELRGGLRLARGVGN